jgi:L-amino acid N-acyltransferase YncA
LDPPSLKLWRAGIFHFLVNMIRAATTADAGQIKDLYNHYILHSVATFEEEPVTAPTMESRINAIHNHCPWLVYEVDGEILGYTYATRWKDRSAYRRSVESTVYVKNGHNGKGIGSSLYQGLLDDLGRQDVHAVIGGISLPNEMSVKLHERFGFQKVAHFREVGYKFGRWIDVGYWELIMPPAAGHSF